MGTEWDCGHSDRLGVSWPHRQHALITLELQALHAAGIREIGMVSDAGLATAARDESAKLASTWISSR